MTETAEMNILKLLHSEFSYLALTSKAAVAKAVCVCNDNYNNEICEMWFSSNHNVIKDRKRLYTQLVLPPVPPIWTKLLKRHKMKNYTIFFREIKLVIIVITIINVVYCSAMNIEFSDDESLTNNHVLIGNEKIIEQSIIYDKDMNYGMLVNSIVKEITQHPFVLFGGPNISTESYTKTYLNVIILTDTLDTKDLETNAFKNLLFSHWSPLYLLITTRDVKYTCINGTLNDSVVDETKNYLNEIWQRFQIVRVVVSFPYTCKWIIIIFDDKEESGTTLYNRTIQLIKPRNKQELATAITRSGNARRLTRNYPLRATIFYRFPTSISECDVVDQYTKLDDQQAQIGYCGLDGLIMRDFVNHYDYNMSVDNTDSCNTYGYMDRENNITSGSLACILSDKVDISFNSRFMVLYTKEDYNYLHYVAQDSLCVILKRPDTVPLWHYAHNLLGVDIWLTMVTCLTVLGVTTWMSAKISAKFSEQRPLKLYSYILDAFTSALFGFFANKERRFRVLKGACLLSSVVILALYQGHVNYEFTTRSRYKEIKTLEELYNSQYTMYTSPFIKDLVTCDGAMHETNKAESAFMKRAQLDEAYAGTLLKYPDRVIATRKQDVMIEVLKSYSDKNGIPLIYIMDECYQDFYLSFITKNDFLFIEESNKFMMRLLEAGLPNKYYMWTRRTYNMADEYPNKGPEPRPFGKIKLQQLRTAFGLLISGYVVSGIVFLIEKWKAMIDREKMLRSNQSGQIRTEDDREIDISSPSHSPRSQTTAAESV